MVVLKFIILIMIFIASNFIGKMIAQKYSTRLDELKELKNNLSIFKTKIKFTYETIPNIFEQISKSSSKNIGKIFKNAKEKMKNTTAQKAWEEAVFESETNLTKTDLETINMLSKMLGKTDVEGQVSQIDITLNFLDKQILEAEEEKAKNEKMYKKLGTVMGLALVIILI